MSQDTTLQRKHYQVPPDPIDERGSTNEGDNVYIRDNSKPPPPRLDSMTFPTNRLPQLDIPIVKRLPEVGQNQDQEGPDLDSNYNVDSSLPLPIVPEKNMFNLWVKTHTQTEVRWSRPENAGNFISLNYEIQIRVGEKGEWRALAENCQPLYRVYYVEGKALFGRTKLSQDETTSIVSLRVRPVGIIKDGGKQEKKFGPWSENILFSLEGKQKT